MSKLSRQKSQGLAICILVIMMVAYHVVWPCLNVYLKKESDDFFSNGQNYTRLKLTGAQKFVLGIPININKAIPDDLTNLPGIGPKTAVGIVAERGRGGLFKSSKDLLRVKGIGPKKLSSFKRFICVEDIRGEDGCN